MKSVAINNSTPSLIVCPWNILHGILGIGYLIAIYHLAHTVNISTAGKFIPRIVGQTIAIHILRYHHDARLAIVLESIALDVKVFLTFHIRYRMIEMKGDVTTIGTQTHQTALVSTDGFCTFSCHLLSIVTLLILRHRIDELSWSRHILIHR